MFSERQKRFSLTNNTHKEAFCCKQNLLLSLQVQNLLQIYKMLENFYHLHGDNAEIFICSRKDVECLLGWSETPLGWRHLTFDDPITSKGLRWPQHLSSLACGLCWHENTNFSTSHMAQEAWHMVNQSCCQTVWSSPERSDRIQFKLPLNFLFILFLYDVILPHPSVYVKPTTLGGSWGCFWRGTTSPWRGKQKNNI